MTDIEILLRVDAGAIPNGARAFFMRDRSQSRRHLYAVVSVLSFLAAVIVAIAALRQVWVFALALLSVFFAVLATPTVAEPGPRLVKRPVMVVTPTIIMLRDSQGFRSWDFDTLAGAEASRHADRLDLILVARDGTRSFVDGRAFDDGDGLLNAISTNLPTARL